jgi:hypothetical protein
MHNHLRAMLTQKGYPASIEEVNISIGVVAFDDYTLWRHGRLLRPDPDNSKVWSVMTNPAERSSTFAATNQDRLRPSRKPALFQSVAENQRGRSSLLQAPRSLAPWRCLFVMRNG